MKNELVRAHRLLCLRFVAEDLFRAAVGGSRGDMNAILAYLGQPARARPHVSPLFEAGFYAAMHADLLEPDEDPLLHFLETGIELLCAPHPLIDLRYISSTDRLILGDPPKIDALMDMLDDDLGSPSPYFDLEFYASQFGAAKGGEPPSGGLLRHYLSNGAHAGRRPNVWMDPHWYVAANPDEPTEPYAAIRHFIVLGDREARAPGPEFSPDLYRRRYTDVADSGLPPLLHYLAYGRQENRQATAEKPAAQAVGIPPCHADRPSCFRRCRHPARCRHARPAGHCQADSQGRRQPNAPRHCQKHQPEGRRGGAASFALSHSACLERADLGEDFEIIVADDASTDTDMLALATIKNLVLVRHPTNLGFLRSCNAAFARCRGEYVLLLNNDTQVLPGAIQHLVAALDSDRTIAACGPKLFYPNGRLQEAGCFVRPNGESGMVGLFADPAEGGYNRDRDVMYCSGAALLVRRALVGDTLFDEIYRPAYCEDVDLCLRLSAAGHRIRFVHKAEVVHHLSVSSNRESIARNQQTLLGRWGDGARIFGRVMLSAYWHSTCRNATRHLKTTSGGDAASPNGPM